MLLGTGFLIPVEWRILMPFIIPFGVIGIWRWSLHIIRMFFWGLYRPIYPKRDANGNPANRFKPSDVTVVIPTLDTGIEFLHAFKSWKSNNPFEIIVVTSEAMAMTLKSFTDSNDCPCRILTVPNPNKRVQLMKGIFESKTPIVALCDDDAIWTDEFLHWMLAPFDDPQMGGVGSRQEMIPVGKHPSFWEVIADFRLSMRMMEASATTFVDGGMSCLSGRTAVYRRCILVDPAFGSSFVNEKWAGKHRLHSGDDKFLTRWLVNHDWKMQLQNHPDAMLSTTFKDSSLFIKQVLRWTRNTWRSDIRSIFIDRKIWFRCKFVTHDG